MAATGGSALVPISPKPPESRLRTALYVPFPAQYEGGEPCSECGHRLITPEERGISPAEASVKPAEILPGFLFLGSYDTASRSELLKAMGITHILNVRPKP